MANIQKAQNFLQLKENANKELNWLIEKSTLVYEDDDHKQFQFKGRLKYSFASKVWTGNLWKNKSSQTGKTMDSGVLNCGFSYWIKQKQVLFSFCIAK